METSVKVRLSSLVALQQIDLEIDEIKRVRGLLPDEIQDLEDGVAQCGTRVEKHETQVVEIESNVSKNRIAIKDAETLVEKYEQQLNQVSNNREFDAITKEIELQKLEVGILNKRIKAMDAKEVRVHVELEQARVSQKERDEDLVNKRVELDNIIEEFKVREVELNQKREKAEKAVEGSLQAAYQKLRSKMVNGLAVVSVKREACGGCFNMVPPQKQSEILEKKKILLCEHCGRILANVEVPVVKEKPPVKRKTNTKEEGCRLGYFCALRNLVPMGVGSCSLHVAAIGGPTAVVATPLSIQGRGGSA